jgi:hypothetical protein
VQACISEDVLQMKKAANYLSEIQLISKKDEKK